MPSFVKPLSLLVARIALASVFVFHGWMKLSFWTDPAAGAGMPVWMLWLMRVLFVLEVAGGLAVLVGAWTHWAVKVLGAIMVGAIAFKVGGMFGSVIPFSSPQGMGWEFDLALLGLAAALMVTGGGAWSVEATLCGCCDKKKK